MVLLSISLLLTIVTFCAVIGFMRMRVDVADLNKQLRDVDALYTDSARHCVTLRTQLESLEEELRETKAKAEKQKEEGNAKITRLQASFTNTLKRLPAVPDISFEALQEHIQEQLQNFTDRSNDALQAMRTAVERELKE